MSKTSQKDFEAFKAEFLRAQELLGLWEWQVHFRIAKLTDSYAQIEYDTESLVADVALNAVVERGFDPVLSGRHEALHLLLAEFSDAASSRHTSKFNLDRAEEEIVHRLERVL